MNAYYFAFCPDSGQMSDKFKYPADAEKAAIEMLEECYLPILVFRAERLVEHVDRKAGTYKVTHLYQ